MNDKAILFQATLYKVNKEINRLKKVGLNMSTYDDLINNIKQECENNISSDTKKFFSGTQAFAEDFVKNIYMEGIRKLELLYHDLTKYEIYIKAGAFINVLKDFLNSDKEYEEFNKLRDSLVDILEKLKMSNTIDYNIEGEIIEDIYNLTYMFIKEEIKIYNKSYILEYLKADDIHKFYIDKMISRELDKLDLREDRYALINVRKNEIDAMGMNATYLDEELIEIIVSTTIDEDYYRKFIDNLNVKLVKYLQEIELLNNKRSTLVKKELNYKKSIKNKLPILFKNVGLFLTSAGISVGLVVGARALSKIGNKEYKRTTTIYSSSEENPTIIEDYTTTKIESGIYLVEYTPYEINASNDYERTITTYDLSEIGILPYQDYYSLDLNALNISGYPSVEEKRTLDLSDIYNETYSVIKQIVVDEDVFNEKPRWWLFIIILFFIIVFDLLIEADCNRDIPILLENTGKLITSIKELLNEIANYNNNEEELKKIYSKMQKLFKDNEDVFAQIEKILPVLKNHPKFIDDSKELEMNLKRVREMQITQY